MGCSQSTIESEESVTRCRARKLYMKDCVMARNAFAAAQSCFANKIKNTGAALTDFAQAELRGHLVHYVQIHPSTIPGSSSSGPLPGLQGLQHSPLPPPPPPLPNFVPPPLQRAVSMPHIKIKKQADVKFGGVTVMEVNEEEQIPEHEKLVRRSRRSKGSDHVVSDPPQGRRDEEVVRSTDALYENNFANYLFPPVDTIPRPTLADPMETESPTAVAEKVYGMNKDDEDVPGRLDEMDEEEEDEDEDDDDDGDVDFAIASDVNKKQEKIVETPPVQVSSPPVPEKKEQEQRFINGESLLSFFEELDDHFLKASQSCFEVTKMLEATRLHYHSNFADNRGHIDHSARVMQVITWNRSIKGVPKIDEAIDEKDYFDEENETHATVLDKILAWEKKLYDEVKVGEQMKYDYQKKVVMLNKKKKRGTNSESLEKLKASVSHLHTRYIVDMQSMDSTVAEINRLRDEQLYPKLTQLVNAMCSMWDMMRKHHEANYKISSQLKQMEITQSPTETTRDHHTRTCQLADAIDNWHLEFCKVIDHQKSYIKALNNWLKLNLIPIESSLREKVSSPPHIRRPPIQDLVAAWDDFMDTLQDDGARSAIKNFSALIRSIYELQKDEISLKNKCEETRQELDRKKRQFEDWHRKYVQQNLPDEADPDRNEENSMREAIAERQASVHVLRKRLEEEEELLRKTSVHVREKSLSNLKSRLPDLFKSMSDISRTFSDNYKRLCSLSTTGVPV